MPSFRTTAVIALFAVGLAACGSSDSAQPADAGSKTSDGTTVVIKTFMFDPDPVTVKAGTTITWNNEDEILHTVTSGVRTYHEDGISKGQAKSIEKTALFDANLDDVGSTFSYTYDTPGTFEYLCTIHPGMDGTVVVE